MNSFTIFGRLATYFCASFYPLFRDTIYRIKTLPPHFLNTLQNNGLFVPNKIGHVMNLQWKELVDKYLTAVWNNNIPVVEELLSSGAVSVDLRFPKYQYGTALHVCATIGQYDLVRLLVDKYHAQVNVKDKGGYIPLEHAATTYNIKILKFLLQRNSEFPNPEFVQNLLNTEEVEELFEAAESNNIKKIAELIIERGLNVDTEDPGNWHRTILEVAASEGYYDLVKILVDTYGANIQHSDELNECAKHMASENGHENIVNFLLERGFKERPSLMSWNQYIDSRDDIKIRIKA